MLRKKKKRVLNHSLRRKSSLYMLIIKRMGDLIVKLEWFRPSKEWQNHIQALRDKQIEQNKILLEGGTEIIWISLADFLRHEIKFLWKLKEWINIKDKEIKEAILDWIQKNIDGRINVLLWKTREFKIDNICKDDCYTEEDKHRTENYWIEWLEALPVTIAEAEKVKEQQVQAMNEAEVQEQIDALSSLESEWL